MMIQTIPRKLIQMYDHITVDQCSLIVWCMSIDCSIVLVSSESGAECPGVSSGQSFSSAMCGKYCDQETWSSSSIVLSIVIFYISLSSDTSSHSSTITEKVKIVIIVRCWLRLLLWEIWSQQCRDIYQQQSKQ